MDLGDLEWFVALAESPHMTRAAERLHTTQPTLSRAIARLEHQVGAPLFDRLGRRLQLNASGEVLLQHARRCLFELRTATSHIHSLRDPDHGTVRLGFLHSVATWLAPELIRRFRAEAPAVQFDLTQAASYQLAAAVSDAAVDLAVTGPRPDVEGLGWHSVHREELCLAVPREHPLADRPTIDIAAAADEPFILLGPNFGLRKLTDELLERAGVVRPRIAFEATEIPTMESLAAAGLGVAIVPRPRRHRADPNAAYLPITDDGAQRELGIAWREGQAESPVVRRLKAFVAVENWNSL